MDPTATLISLLETLCNLQAPFNAEDDERLRAKAIEDLRILADWLQMGGFAPDADKAVVDRAFHLR